MLRSAYEGFDTSVLASGDSNSRSNNNADAARLLSPAWPSTTPPSEASTAVIDVSGDGDETILQLQVDPTSGSKRNRAYFDGVAAEALCDAHDVREHRDRRIGGSMAASMVDSRPAQRAAIDSSGLSSTAHGAAAGSASRSANSSGGSSGSMFDAGLVAALGALNSGQPSYPAATTAPRTQDQQQLLLLLLQYQEHSNQLQHAQSPSARHATAALLPEHGFSTRAASMVRENFAAAAASAFSAVDLHIDWSHGDDDDGRGQSSSSSASFELQGKSFGAAAPSSSLSSAAAAESSFTRQRDGFPSVASTTLCIGHAHVSNGTRVRGADVTTSAATAVGGEGPSAFGCGRGYEMQQLQVHQQQRNGSSTVNPLALHSSTSSFVSRTSTNGHEAATNGSMSRRGSGIYSNGLTGASNSSNKHNTKGSISRGILHSGTNLLPQSVLSKLSSSFERRKSTSETANDAACNSSSSSSGCRRVTTFNPAAHGNAQHSVGPSSTAAGSRVTDENAAPSTMWTAQFGKTNFNSGYHWDAAEMTDVAAGHSNGQLQGLGVAATEHSAHRQQHQHLQSLSQTLLDETINLEHAEGNGGYNAMGRSGASFTGNGKQRTVQWH